MTQQEAQTIVQVKNVDLRYEVQGRLTTTIVEDISFSIQAGEKFVIIGPSGCGKSTLLKAIAGYLQPQKGEILLNGQQVKKPGPDRAVVFQDFEQLFAWKTALENVAYALRATRKITRAQARERAQYYLDLVNVGKASHKFPHMLSGGMKQRVALARALALEPAILLMDEPFGALDAITRTQLQHELNEIWRKTGVTIVLVTHSIQEAVYLGQRVLVLSTSPASIRKIVDTSDIHTINSEHFQSAATQLRLLLADQDEEIARELALSAAE